MSKTNVAELPIRRSPIRDVQGALHDIERRHDETLAEIGHLIATMLRVGAEAGVSPADGQQALDRAIASMTTGARMRALVIAAHQDLRDIYGKIDVRELGYGALMPSPDTSAQAIEAMLDRSTPEVRS